MTWRVHLTKSPPAIPESARAVARVEPWAQAEHAAMSAGSGGGEASTPAAASARATLAATREVSSHARRGAGPRPAGRAEAPSPRDSYTHAETMAASPGASRPSHAPEASASAITRSRSP